MAQKWNIFWGVRAEAAFIVEGKLNAVAAGGGHDGAGAGALPEIFGVAS